MSSMLLDTFRGERRHRGGRSLSSRKSARGLAEAIVILPGRTGLGGLLDDLGCVSFKLI